MGRFFPMKALVLSGARTTHAHSQAILARLVLKIIVSVNLAVKELMQIFVQMNLSVLKKSKMQLKHSKTIKLLVSMALSLNY